MKRIVYILMIFTMIFALVSCNEKPVDMPVAEDAYEKINELFENEYSIVTLYVKTVNDGITLENSYTLSDSVVIYKIQKLSSLTLDGDDSFITEHSGNAFIDEDGKITGEFDNTELPAYEVLTGKFVFDEDCFEDVEFGDESFDAKIVNLAKFISTDLIFENAEIHLEFSQNSIKNMRITFSSDGANVEYYYTFA